MILIVVLIIWSLLLSKLFWIVRNSGFHFIRVIRLLRRWSHLSRYSAQFRFLLSRVNWLINTYAFMMWLFLNTVFQIYFFFLWHYIRTFLYRRLWLNNRLVLCIWCVLWFEIYIVTVVAHKCFVAIRLWILFDLSWLHINVLLIHAYLWILTWVLLNLNSLRLIPRDCLRLSIAYLPIKTFPSKVITLR